ncbi:hypothetical protein Pmani_011833 [Petrolisthes manimaculis]|uniref:Uncharacterized protein n=1 Tax=Petrolisthes manimaculis TaxID=1843537 RepID=A0AAE1UE07_9EUCA|nr:hypothetical protein Pmani_011833 [Petrolisthes manimaculis]
MHNKARTVPQMRTQAGRQAPRERKEAESASLTLHGRPPPPNPVTPLRPLPPDATNNLIGRPINHHQPIKCDPPAAAQING